MSRSNGPAATGVRKRLRTSRSNGLFVHSNDSSRQLSKVRTRQPSIFKRLPIPWCGVRKKMKMPVKMNTVATTRLHVQGMFKAYHCTIVQSTHVPQEYPGMSRTIGPPRRLVKTTVACRFGQTGSYRDTRDRISFGRRCKLPGKSSRSHSDSKRVVRVE